MSRNRYLAACAAFALAVAGVLGAFPTFSASPVAAVTQQCPAGGAKIQPGSSPATISVTDARTGSPLQVVVTIVRRTATIAPSDDGDTLSGATWCVKYGTTAVSGTGTRIPASGGLPKDVGYVVVYGVTSVAPGNLEVIAVTADASGWVLAFGGPTSYSTEVTGSGATGIRIVRPGTYTISETAAAGTDGSLYDTTWACTVNGSPYASGTGTTISGVTVGSGDVVICTFTNTLHCLAAVTVTGNADAGTGSLREAIDRVCAGGTIGFAPDLAGETITLTSGALALATDVTIDGSAAPGLTVSGNHERRVLVVNAGTTATVRSLTLADGEATDLAGAVLDNGTLTLDRVTVANSHVNAAENDWWKGGGGIYVGGGGALALADSTVRDNSTQLTDGGGLFGFQNSTVTVARSTISGNTAGNVGGGVRSLGATTITNSTLSGNASLAWHGGAIFHTDGTLAIEFLTIANNRGPDWAPSAIFVGSFSAVVPTATISNSVITGNQWYACDHWTGGVTFSSGGHNLVQDATCNATGTPDPTDIVTSSAGIGSLADNGGPTLTHALLAGSPAIDAAADGGCPATDQRGVARPKGAHCDIGSVEYEPPVLMLSSFETGSDGWAPASWQSNPGTVSQSASFHTDGSYGLRSRPRTAAGSASRRHRPST